MLVVACVGVEDDYGYAERKCMRKKRLQSLELKFKLFTLALRGTVAVRTDQPHRFLSFPFPALSSPLLFSSSCHMLFRICSL